MNILRSLPPADEAMHNPLLRRAVFAVDLSLRRDVSVKQLLAEQQARQQPKHQQPTKPLPAPHHQQQLPAGGPLDSLASPHGATAASAAAAYSSSSSSSSSSSEDEEEDDDDEEDEDEDEDEDENEETVCCSIHSRSHASRKR